MWRKLLVLCFAGIGLLSPRMDHFARAEAAPSILSSEVPNLQQFQTRPPLDLRPRLSASQQTQILSDVQQHQQYSFPPSDAPLSTQIPNLTSELTFPTDSSGSSNNNNGGTTAFSSLARYKVDRKKQNQQIQQQLQSLQQRIQQQQQQINSQLSQTILQTNNPLYQQQLLHLQQQQQQQSQQQQHQHQQQQLDLKNQYSFNNYNPTNYQTLPTIPLPSIPGEFSHPFYSEQQNQQLQEYYEKQRQLELLQRQREQLLLEQQELRRQQELLRLQQLQLKSTILPITGIPIGSTTISPLTSLSSSSVSAPSTTPSTVLLSSPSARKITPSENEIFLKAIATHQKKFTTTQKPPATSQKSSRQERLQDSNNEPTVSKDLLALIQAQQNQQPGKQSSKPQIKVIYQTEKPSTSSKSSKNSGSTDKDLLLKQLKLALAQAGLDDKDRNVTTRDIVLPNGKKLQVIHAPNGLPSATTTIKPPKAILEELTKGVVPPGADFEVLRQSGDGKLEELGKNPLQNQPAKKVTFVVLEEQPDGSYKVQGVKGNAEKDFGSDVDSIVERIKKGELKLPPSSTKNPVSSVSPSSPPPPSPSSERSHSSSISSTTRLNATLPTTFRPTLPTTRSPQVSVSPNSVSSNDKYVTSASSISGHVLNSIGASTTGKPSQHVSHVTVKYPSSQYSSSSVSSVSGLDNEIFSSTTPSSFEPSSNYVDIRGSSTVTATPGSSTKVQAAFVTPSPNYATTKESLSNLLRREGLFAMAKYLRQSGLDAVLNETGPYTIFVPTDKAFRTLLVQLGGPEKAEQKFRDNPRLLSGLLLHHVVPGAFRIESLQDEMTGVSLAGTQLRVNVYSMHDHEWNDIKVTTINGARVAPNKRDVEVPQGLAHAIDRVMFPLPVGDLVQTLQADRERRFSVFLKILHAAGLEEMLSGTKTFTVFAPTDAAFAEASSKNGDAPVWQESDGPEAAKEIVLRHVIPTTLYTAGMRYYHQKETLRQQVPIQIQKTGGRIRVNEGHIVTYNVPATNGVLHAIDTVL